MKQLLPYLGVSPPNLEGGGMKSLHALFWALDKDLTTLFNTEIGGGAYKKRCQNFVHDFTPLSLPFNLYLTTSKPHETVVAVFGR